LLLKKIAGKMNINHKLLPENIKVKITCLPERRQVKHPINKP
jgi:hypothetical protein